MLICILRYCIMPYFLSVTSTYLSFASDFNHIDEGICLMVYEMVIAFGYIHYRYLGHKLVSSSHLMSVAFKSSIYFITASVFIITTFLNYNYFFRGIVLLGQYKIDNSEDFEMPAGMFILWGTSLLWLYSYSIYLISRKKFSTKIKITTSIIFTLVLIFLTFVSQSSISRWYTIICACSGYFLLLKCYPKNKRLINITVITPIIVLISIVTTIKNFSDENESVDIVIGSWMNAYLAGPISVNNGIGMNEKIDIGCSAIMPDMLNNLPIVNHYIDRNQSTAYHYNDYIGRFFEEGSQGDQIIPLISQGQTFFGTVFSPILTILFIWLFSRFDFKYICISGYKTFLYAFIASWCAVTPILNMTINVSWWWIRILPLMAFLTFIDVSARTSIKETINSNA